MRTASDRLGPRAISFSRTELIFLSTRPGGLGLADLYGITRSKLTGKP